MPVMEVDWEKVWKKENEKKKDNLGLRVLDLDFSSLRLRSIYTIN